MASIYRKTYLRPVPKNAEISTRRGKRIATWNDNRGKRRTAPVETTKAGEDRIKVVASNWTAKYRDGEGFIREVATGCSNKQAAQSVLNDLVRRAELVKANVMTDDQDRISEHQITPLVDHIKDFLTYQKQKKTHPDRVKNYETRLNESARKCGFRRLADLSVDRLECWLAEERSGNRKMSASVYNGYREAWLAFGNWCIGKRVSGKRSHFNGERRLIANPFEGMAKLDEKAEPRRKARAMTHEELSRLLAAGADRPLREARTVRRGKNAGQLRATPRPRRWVSLIKLGYERALIYKTAVLTGLRADELRTLQVKNLSFGDVPFVKLERSNEKNRKGSTIPLRSDLADDLKAWVSGLDRASSVFNVPAGILRILNRDLKAAGIPKRDPDGCVVHVHALRHSFGTHLSLANVAPRVAQAAMRHSNINLTMGTYTDTRLLDTVAAVESLPVLRFTASRPDVPQDVPNGDIPGGIEGQIGGEASADKPAPKTTKPRKTQGFTGFSEVGDTELESVTSTMSTSRHREGNAGKHGTKTAGADPMCQWMCQIAEATDSLCLHWEELDEQQRRRIAPLVAEIRSLTATHQAAAGDDR